MIVLEGSDDCNNTNLVRAVVETYNDPEAAEVVEDSVVEGVVVEGVGRHRMMMIKDCFHLVVEHSRLETDDRGGCRSPLLHKPQPLL